MRLLRGVKSEGEISVSWGPTPILSRIMASIFSGADLLDHVKTQLPYALTVIGVIGVLYVIFGFTEMSPFILLAIGLVSLYFLQIILHKYYLKKYNIDPNYSKFMTEDHKKE